MTNENTAPAGELTDEQIKAAANEFMRDIDDYDNPERAILACHVEGFSRAIIAADRALRASLAVGAVAMPVVGGSSEDGGLTSAASMGKHDAIAKSRTNPLILQSIAQAALAAKDAKIAGMWTKEQVQRMTASAIEACEITHGQEIADLTAERDHWKANHDTQVQRARLLVEREDMPVERVKAYEQVVTLTTERDALRKDAAAVSTQAARDVLTERQRQIGVEGWTPEHDDEHDSHEMAHAAACYAYPELTALVGVKTWPWAPEWFKVRSHRGNYVRAAALLLAEIERIDRAAMTKEA